MTHAVVQARRLLLWAVGGLLLVWSSPVKASDPGETRFTVKDRVVGHVDHRLFGQFLERASWGEAGPEAARVPGTRELQPSVVQRLREMQVPVIRFPGGTDVDYIDWCDLIDNAPGRGKERPTTTRGNRGHEITNNFGYDEFLRLCQDLGTQPLIVLNLRDGLVRLKPLEEAARHAAGLVAYCNAAQGAKLPAGMPDWPAVRAQNGHPEPYGVRYFEIGNEIEGKWQDIRDLGLEEEEAVDWYLTCVAAYVKAMREVDPGIEIVVDGDLRQVLPLLRSRLGETVQHLAHHRYVPWTMSEITKDGEPYPLEKLTAEEIWNAWVGVPEVNPVTGMSEDRAAIYDLARRDGYRVAITEWNWNGWFGRGEARPALNSRFAKGIGAAGFLHAFMREGDAISLGCQSMLVGVRWDINAIRAEPTGEHPAYFFPSGQVTMFYGKHHGSDLLAVTGENVPRYRQPYEMGSIRPRETGVASLDVLATAGRERIYFHAINRSFAEDLPVEVDLSAFTELGATVTQHCFEGRLEDRPASGEPREMGRFRSTPVNLDGSVLHVTLPKRSISIVEIPCVRGE